MSGVTGSGVVPSSLQMLSAKEEVVMKEYSSSLEDLTINSKPLINMLTMLAEENSAYASVIVMAIENHLLKVPSDIKLPVLYLIDSIMKNVGKPYPALFTQNIVSTFCSVFEKVDEKTRAQMFKLRHTWNLMFPAKKMYALDARVNAIDPAWPITAPPPTTSIIHVNPLFIKGGSPSGSSAGSSSSVTTMAASGSSGGVNSSSSSAGAVTTAMSSPSSSGSSTNRSAAEDGTLSEAQLRENLLKKKKELLELQQKKLELELLQTKKKLEEQEKQLEKTTTHLKSSDTKSAIPSDLIMASKKTAKIQPSAMAALTLPSRKSQTSRSEQRKSRSQRKAAMVAAIAAAEASNSKSIISMVPTSSTTSAPVTTVAASSVNVTTNSTGSSGSVTRSKPCAPVAPVVSVSTPASAVPPQHKVLKLTDGMTTSSTPSATRIAPVSIQLVKAVRSRDPRLLRNSTVSKSELPPKPSAPSVPAAPPMIATASIPVPPVAQTPLPPLVLMKPSSSVVVTSSVPPLPPNLPPVSIVAPLPQLPPPISSVPVISDGLISVSSPVTTAPIPVSPANTTVATSALSSISTPVVVTSSSMVSSASDTTTASSVLSTSSTNISNSLNISNSSSVSKHKITSDLFTDPVIKLPFSPPVLKVRTPVESKSKRNNRDKEITKRLERSHGSNKDRKEKKYHRANKPNRKKELESKNIKRDDLFVSVNKNDQEKIKDSNDVNKIKENKISNKSIEVQPLSSQSSPPVLKTLPLSQSPAVSIMISIEDNVIRTDSNSSSCNIVPISKKIKQKKNKLKSHKKLLSTDNDDKKIDIDNSSVKEEIICDDISDKKVVCVSSNSDSITESSPLKVQQPVFISDNPVIEKSQKKLLNKEFHKEQLQEDRKRSSSPKISSPKSKLSKLRKSPSPRLSAAIRNIEKIISSQDDKEDEIVPSPPPPPPSSSSVEGSDKFKERKTSTIKRMRSHMRHRELSVSPPPPAISTSSDSIASSSPSQTVPLVTSADTDLRVPPIDDVKSNASAVAGLESAKDVDLRALAVSGAGIPLATELLSHSPKRRSTEREANMPPMKKSKMDKLDALFGREDTDMRQELAPPLPSPPPPPIISPLTEMDNCEERCWAKYKQGKPDLYKSMHRHNSRDESPTTPSSLGPYRRNRVDRLGRPFLYHRSSHGSGSEGSGHSRSARRRSDSYYENENPRSSNRSHYNYILREAEEQFKAGVVPISTYNRVVKEVITMNEQKKLDEAIRRDEQENIQWKRRHHGSLSPGSASGYENNMNMMTSDSEYETKESIPSPKKSYVAPTKSSSPKKGSDKNADVSEKISRKPDIVVSEESISNLKDTTNLDSQLYGSSLIKSEQNIPQSVETDIKPIVSASDVDLRQLQTKPLIDLYEFGEIKSHDELNLNSTSICKEENEDQEEEKGKFEKTSCNVSEDVKPSKDITIKQEGDEDLGVVGENSNELVELPSKDDVDNVLEVDDSATDRTDIIKQKQELINQSSDIDSRIMPPSEFIKRDNDQLSSLLPPPPYPKDILQQLDDSHSQPPLLPDPAIIASKDTDLRIGQRPILSGLPPVGMDIEPPTKLIMMEYSDDFPETKPEIQKMDVNPSEMEVEQYVPRMEGRNRGIDSRNQLSDVDVRMYQPTKKFTRFPDMESDLNQGRNPAQDPPRGMNKMPGNIPTGPWDQPPTQLPPSNMPGPGGLGPGGPGPWTRQLLRPPPGMMLQNRFNTCWPNNPPMMPQQIAPIRPPPPPPAGIFEPDVPGNVRFPHFPPRPPRFGPPMPTGPSELPPADPLVLDMIAADTMRTINIDGVPREIRYYGETAVVMMSWDDPREIMFQGPPRRVTINDKDSLVLPFNAPFREFIFDDKPHRIRLGGPTRELCIDNAFYECFFGGPPINVDIGVKSCKVQLEGPPPQVRIGSKRTDLVIGKVNLIVDARDMFPIFLDPKPQRFDIDGVPYIFRFVQALETVVINGQPIKLEFGGLPKPIYARGKKYFIRLSALPRGVMPGYVDIINMEGGRRGSPPPIPPAPLPVSSGGGVIDPDQENSQDSDGMGSYSNPVSPVRHELPHDERSMPVPEPDSKTKPAIEMPAKQSSPEQQRKRSSKVNSLDVLTSLIAPAVQTPSSGYSYSVEQPAAVETAVVTTSQTEGSTATTQTAAENKHKDAASTVIPFLGQLNVDELFQRLVATGIVPSSIDAAGKKDDATEKARPVTTPEESSLSIKPVDFKKPETLKVRQPALISILFSGIQCSSCGVRFPPEQTIKYSQHLDWHFRQNRRDRDSTRKAQSRKWYYDVSDWIQFEEIEDLEERAQSWFDTQAQQNVTAEDEVANDIPSVPCENGLMDVECEMCKDKFEQFYNEEKEEWHLRRAVKVDDKIYHPICYEDYQNSLNAVPTEMDETKPDEEEDEERDRDVNMDSLTDVIDDDDDVIIQEPENKPVIIELIKDDDEEEEEAAALLKAAEEEKAKKLNESDTTISESVVDESQNDIIKTDGVDMETDDGIIADKMKITTDADSDKDLKEDNNSVELKNSDEIVKIVKSIKQEPMDDVEEIENIIDLEHLVIKKEKVDEDEDNLIPKPVVDTTHTTVACSIDGNVELFDTSNVLPAAPSKIKINISKPVAVSSHKDSSSTVIFDDNSLSQDEIAVQQPPSASAVLPLNIVETLQPPPPGEEPGPLHLKPRLVGKKLKEIPPVSKGTELSGLCSIM